MQSSPLALYDQSIDKQRVVVVGKSKTRIAQLILFVLNYYRHPFDYSIPSAEQISDAPIIIFEPTDETNVLEFQHHILVISELSPEQKSNYSSVALATPKSGTIIYDENNLIAKEIAKVNKMDVAENHYTAPSLERENGKLIFTSSSDRVTLPAFSADDLKCVGAAQELAKMIGVSPIQFYKAISTFA